MNREEAIAIIRKEILCVNRDCDIERSCGKCDLVMPSKEPILEAYRMAIKDLQSITALSADLKVVDRDSMDKKTLIGFNMAVALMNKHLGGAE